jgi:hypothetical protein
MSLTRQRGNQHPMSQLAENRARVQREQAGQRTRAVRTVTRHSRDLRECTDLLSMLGLDDESDEASVFERSLARYIGHVAVMVGVPAEAVGHEVSDTATAYLGLTARFPEYPTSDLMLVWDERLGWYVGLEPRAGEQSSVVSFLGGDAVPAPAAVAAFVTTVVAGRYVGRLRPVLPPSTRAALSARMTTRCVAAPVGAGDLQAQ